MNINIVVLVGIAVLVIAVVGVLVGSVIRVGGRGVAASEPAPLRRARPRDEAVTSLVPRRRLMRMRGFTPNEGWPKPGDGDAA
jgi:hypothetical protein